MGSATIKHICTAPLLLALAIGLIACGEEVSTSSFKGEQAEVAKRISDFQSDATKGETKSICQNDLTAALRTRLKGSSECEKAIKDQLAEIDTFTLSIESIAIKGTSASAQVKSTYSGKTKSHTLELLKEGQNWKISSVS